MVPTEHYDRTNGNMYTRLFIIKVDFNLKFAFTIGVATSRLCIKNQIMKERFEIYQIMFMSNTDASFQTKLPYVHLKTEIKLVFILT